MKYGLKEPLLSNVNRVFAKHPEIEKVILYGSRAKGNYRPGSDIDLTLVGDQLDNSRLNRISCELDDLLLPYTFDLSIYGHITNPDLLAHIKDVGIVFYSAH